MSITGTLTPAIGPALSSTASIITQVISTESTISQPL